jgi:hypothetical protein
MRLCRADQAGAERSSNDEWDDFSHFLFSSPLFSAHD